MGTGDPTTPPGAPVDVFVSYAGADEAWALWVAAVLETEGRTVAIEAWDVPAGTNLVSWVNEQMTRAARMVVICSHAYFSSHWHTPAWTGALMGNTLIPLRVADCALPPVLATIASRDLHHVDEPTARRRLVEAVGLARPERRSGGFPGRPTPVFPGSPPEQDGTPTALAAARPPGAVRVTDADPYRLGVHRAIHLPGTDDDTPPDYVARDIDDTPTGIRARLRTAAARGGFVLLVGGSSVGKTRCAVEAINAELADWWLIHPTDTAQITALADNPPARTVLWLDEIQTYLNSAHGLTAGTVRALLDAGMVLVGTIWPHRYRTFTTPPPPGTLDDPYRWERDALRQAAIVDVDNQLTPAEQARARAVADKDPRIRVGLESPDDGLTQTLAAAPALLRHWSSAKTDAPYTWAVITAALDATRLGVRTPLTTDLLRAAAPDYCTPRQQATAPPHWFEDALAYATTPLHGATATLNPIATGMGQLTGYTVADYLLHHTTRTRRHERGPASLWTALRDHLTHPDDLTPVTTSALNRRIYTTAVPLLRRQANTGDRDAARRLAWLLARAGERDKLSARAANQLAWLRARTREHGELQARADNQLARAGDRDKLSARAANRLAELRAGLLAAAGRRQAAIGILRPRADAGDEHAAWQLARLLAEAGDRDELRARADAGDEHAASQLARLLARAGDRDELRARADAGDEDATNYLINLLAEAGDRDELCARADADADAGGWYAAWQLINLLAEAGDRDELRARADAGDEHAASQLSWLLAEAGDRDELRARADAGDEHAADRLADLLAQEGDPRLRRYGFDVHGRIADGPTW